MTSNAGTLWSEGANSQHAVYAFQPRAGQVAHGISQLEGVGMVLIVLMVLIVHLHPSNKRLLSYKSLPLINAYPAGSLSLINAYL